MGDVANSGRIYTGDSVGSNTLTITGNLTNSGDFFL